MTFWSDPLILIFAILLDLIWADPAWLPHPVIYIGKIITCLEHLLRAKFENERFAGVLLLIITTSITGIVTWGGVLVIARLSDLAAYLFAILIASTTFAARSLHLESRKVANAIVEGDIKKARLQLSHIVGRDTADLDEPEIWRALVETVAENSSDGIIAPMFWFAVGGPVAAMKYKAVNTLDSMVGYKNVRYLRFGWASARMDDLLNYIPARLTAWLMILSAPFVKLSMISACSIYLRDRHNHPSPNSGHPESVAAGALKIRLGGAASYGGISSFKEYIGNADSPLDEQAYRGMIKLMYATTILMALLCSAILYSVKGLYVPSL